VFRSVVACFRSELALYILNNCLFTPIDKKTKEGETNIGRNLLNDQGNKCTRQVHFHKVDPNKQYVMESSRRKTLIHYFVKVAVANRLPLCKSNGRAVIHNFVNTKMEIVEN
jgi:hypothetical protein